MSSNSIFISVDPGVEGACAVFTDAHRVPITTKIWNPPSALSWELRVFRAAEILSRVCEDYGPYAVWCEWPALHEDSEGGRKTARTGSLVKLAASVGTVMEISRQFGAKFMPVPVMEWKGQMSKEAVKHRIIKRLGASACGEFKSHAWDAVGIGLHKKGIFKCV